MRQNKIAYYDWKPENIMIDKNFNVYLIDFGFAYDYSTNEIDSRNGEYYNNVYGSIDYKGYKAVLV